MIRIFAICTLLIATLAACAAAGPTAIQYQGKLTDGAGRPVPDGNYQVVFSLFTAPTNKFAAWVSPTTIVTVQGGVFATSFSPTQSVILNNDNLWLQTKVNSDTLSKVPLQTVPYAIRANSADIAKAVSPGGVTTEMLALDVALARAQFVTGITSNLPSTLKLRFYLDGVEIGSNPVLAAPYKEQVEVVQYQDGEDRIIRLRPGRVRAGNVVIRRPVSSDTTLRNSFISVANGTVTRKTLTMILFNGTTELARWTLSNAWVRAHNYRMADDGLPVEEVEFVAEGAVVRKTIPATTTAPEQKFLQQGFLSGQPAGTIYELLSGGTPIQDIALVGDVEIENEVIEYIDGIDITIRKRPGLLKTGTITVRQNPYSRSDLATWYKTVTDAKVERKTLVLALSNAGVRQSLMQYSYAWPSSYTLRIADDGQPVEEYGIVYELPAAP